MSAAVAAITGMDRGEAELAARWAAAPAGPLRLEDGRVLRIVFPGVAGGGAGPDFRNAILDAGGDLLWGDVEIHLRATGWRQHGHHRDAAYGAVALHVVGRNDTGEASTLHGSGRAIAILVLAGGGEAGFPPPFTPPCVLAVANGARVAPALARLGERRLRMKAARMAPMVVEHGAGGTLAAALLEFLGGPANRAAFSTIGRRLPLAALLERADGAAAGTARALAVTAELKAVAAQLVIQRAGLRPMASPVRRLEAAGALIARLWPEGASGDWPAMLGPEAVPRLLRVAGVGEGQAVELAINAVLAVALAGGVWAEETVMAVFGGLRAPGTYGKLRPLERWLGSGERPFSGARALQGGLLLHADYCTRGKCGRCPISPPHPAGAASCE